MATKKPASKKAPTKSTVKKVHKARKSVSARSMRREIETRDFMTFQLTRDTIYWLIFGGAAILFTIWIMQLQMDIQALYDQVDQSNNAALLE